MTETAERNRSQSMGVFAIVGGLLVAVGAAMGLGAAMVLLWLLVWSASSDGPGGELGDDPTHVVDTEHGTPELPQAPEPGRRASPTDPDYGDPTRGGPGSGPPPGPVSLIIPKANAEMFLSIELNCPSGYRNRGNFGKVDKSSYKATVNNVPGGERCTVTFQGSAPVKVWVYANQTLSCTFEPVACYPVH